MIINKIIFSLLIPTFLAGCISNNVSHVQEAHKLFDQGNYSASIIVYSKAIEENASKAENYYYRGLAWLMGKDNERALQDFSKAIEINPNYVSAYINRGSILKNTGDYDMSLADYNKVVQLKPSDLRALAERAELLLKTNKVDRAISDYNVLIKNKYNIPNSYLQRADAKYFKFDYEGAIKDYSSSIISNPKSPYAYNNLAWVLATCVDAKYRDGERAVSYAKMAVKIDANKNNLHTLALAYAEVGSFDLSISIMEEIIAQNDLNENEISLFESDLASLKEQKPLRKIPFQ